MHAARSKPTLVATAVLAGLAGLILVVALAVPPLVYGGDGPPSITGRDALAIGVRDDLPGRSFRAGDGSLKGFDIDVATYVAGLMDVPFKDLTFRALGPDEWERALSQGKVDMVVAYTITHERKERVTFAGPYYVPHQAPFGGERYGIGLRKGDVEGCHTVNRVLAGMYQGGAAETLFHQWFTTPGSDAAAAVPRFEGCG